MGFLSIVVVALDDAVALLLAAVAAVWRMLKLLAMGSNEILAATVALIAQMTDASRPIADFADVSYLAAVAVGAIVSHKTNRAIEDKGSVDANFPDN